MRSLHYKIFLALVALLLGVLACEKDMTKRNEALAFYESQYNRIVGTAGDTLYFYSNYATDQGVGYNMRMHVPANALQYPLIINYYKYTNQELEYGKLNDWMDVYTPFLYFIGQLEQFGYVEGEDNKVTVEFLKPVTLTYMLDSTFVNSANKAVYKVQMPDFLTPSYNELQYMTGYLDEDLDAVISGSYPDFYESAVTPISLDNWTVLDRAHYVITDSSCTFTITDLNHLYCIASTHNQESNTINFPDTAIEVPEGRGLQRINIGMNPIDGDFPVTVKYKLSGTAKLGADYLLSDTDGNITGAKVGQGTITFGKGVSQSSISVVVLDDSITETSENLIVTLTDPTNATLGQQYRHTLKLLDNDSRKVSFPIIRTESEEREMDIEITVEVEDMETSAAASFDFEVNLYGADTSDFRISPAHTHHITIPPGKTNETITLRIKDDLVVEDDETIEILLKNPKNCALGNSRYLHVIKANDNRHVQFERPALTVNETDGTATVYVTLDEPEYLKGVDVDYSVTGTASALLDHNLDISGTLTIPPGAYTAPLTFSLLNDVNVEGNEQITISLVGASDATIGNTRQTTVLITDDDVTRALSLTAQEDTVSFMTPIDGDPLNAIFYLNIDLSHIDPVNETDFKISIESDFNTNDIYLFGSVDVYKDLSTSEAVYVSKINRSENSAQLVLVFKSTVDQQYNISVRILDTSNALTSRLSTKNLIVLPANP